MALSHQYCRQVRADKHARTECRISHDIGSIADSPGEQARNLIEYSK